jgi:hypothetical protein
VTPRSLPTRTLADRPDLDQLRRQAKELLDAFRAGEPDAVVEVTAHYHNADRATFALHDAQLVIARAYGFESWPKLKAYVEGATAQRFIEAVRAHDLPQIRAMLQARPELSGSGLHVAVVERAPELVRELMQHGANARTGIYPHRDATSALTIATERGYAEIVTIIREEERNRQQAKSGVAAPADELFEAIHLARCGREAGSIGSDPQEHAAWLGVPVGTSGTREAVLGSGGGSGRGRYGAMGKAPGVGKEEGARRDRSRTAKGGCQVGRRPHVHHDRSPRQTIFLVADPRLPHALLEGFVDQVPVLAEDAAHILPYLSLHAIP